MSSKTFKKGMLASSIAMVLTSGATSFAMAAEEANTAKEDQIERIEVRGIRGSLKANLNAKRYANAVVESVTAEDIGKFPDKNIAETLQRVSGVTINRGFTGEGNEVSIRGIDPQLTQVQLNGNFVASTAWFSQSANNRAFNMDLMPSELVAGVDVYKSPQANIDEGGVGGTIIMRTRKPLDLKANTMFGSVEANTNSLADDSGLGLTGMYSWKNEQETAGILVTASTLETIGRARKGENYWEEGWSASGISAFDQDRTRDAFDITAQFAASDDLVFTGHVFYTKLDAFNTNQNMLVLNGCCGPWNGNDENGGFGGNYTSTGRTADGANGLPLTGSVTNANGISQDINTRRAEIETNVYEITAEYQGNGYTVKTVLGTTKSDGGNGGNYGGGWGLAWGPGVGDDITAEFDMDLNDRIYLQVPGQDFTDPSTFKHLYGSLGKTALTDEETYAQVDFVLEVDLGAISEIETGVKIRTHEFTQSQSDASFKGGTLELVSDISQFDGGIISDFGEVITSDSISSYVRLDGGKYANYVDSQIESWGESDSAHGKVKEDIISSYVQANFNGDAFRGNVGLRYAQTDITGISFDPTGNIANVDGSYADWLPSFNLALDLADDLILRMSAARVMSRASYSQLTPSYSNINPTSYTAARGNPNIKPFRATQTDIGIEYYFNEESLFSVAYFTKDIKSFITSKQVDAQFPDVNGVIQDWRVTVPVQGRGGNVDGVELQYQQVFGKFGAIVNYTYTDAEAENDEGEFIQLPGNSRNSYNLTGYYEDESYAARLAYTYRSDFLAPGTAIANQLDTNDAQSFLDASFTWHASENIDVTLEGINLLGEIVYARHSGGAQTLRTAVDNGTRYFMKVTFRM
ncbi:MAG: TonB-dependent receptor [Alteromonadaceae bacterium]|nr:TonB-dependent receptor [Alteromonadaceae bacterium]